MAGGWYKLDKQAWHINRKYGFAPRLHTKYDTHYNPENEYCMVVANNRDGTNCLIKFKPEELI